MQSCSARSSSRTYPPTRQVLPLPWEGRAMSSEGSGQELVVVGVDGSAESVAALRWAARYASASGARVRAMLAWHYPAAAGEAPVGVAPDAIRAQTEAQMQATLDEAIAKAYAGQDSAGA